MLWYKMFVGWSRQDDIVNLKKKHGKIYVYYYLVLLDMLAERLEGNFKADHMFKISTYNLAHMFGTNVTFVPNILNILQTYFKLKCSKHVADMSNISSQYDDDITPIRSQYDDDMWNITYPKFLKLQDTFLQNRREENRIDPPSKRGGGGNSFLRKNSPQKKKKTEMLINDNLKNVKRVN